MANLEKYSKKIPILTLHGGREVSKLCKTGLEHHEYGMAKDHRHHPSKKPENKK